MPGLVVFRRRWSIGSDDLVVPAVCCIVVHVIWLILLGLVLGLVPFDTKSACMRDFKENIIGYMVLISTGLVLEAFIAGISLRGTIVNTEPRASMPYLLYIRLGLLVIEFAWLVVGVIWVVQYYSTPECSDTMLKKVVLGIVVSNWIVVITTIIAVGCSFDTSGRNFVKMKYYTDNQKKKLEKETVKRKISRSSNLKQKKLVTSYEKKWDRRVSCWFCCMKSGTDRKSSFKEVAVLFAEYFRELDVVVTDVLAGLLLLRRQQKMQQTCIVGQNENNICRFLSGTPVTPKTKFLRLKEPEVLAEYKKIIHYKRYALGCYGWPAFMFMHPCTGTCRALPYLRCTCCCFNPCLSYRREQLKLNEDNCCQCNYAALKKIAGLSNLDIVYVTYCEDIGQTPFYVALDHTYKKIVISIRGTLSLSDVITDLKADAEELPVDPRQPTWLGHKGMIHSAMYIKNKLIEEMILPLAFGRDRNKGTQDYGIVIVGHSLGAGVAAILAILLEPEYPDLHCYAYSPPGGLLSCPAAEHSKSFVTSIVLGKDIVPRLGLFQMENMRADIVNVIQKCRQPKWKIIGQSMKCCGEVDVEFGVTEALQLWEKRRKLSRRLGQNVNTEVCSSTPLHLPGKIIHIVRTHPKEASKSCHKAKPVYQAVWADKSSFGEVLVSPRMISDHMPDNVLSALQKVLINVGPKKPAHLLPESERKALLADEADDLNGQLETSFSNAQAENNRHSKVASELSWDYTTMEDVAIAMNSEANTPVEKKDSFVIDVSKEPWDNSAPIASTESLSDETASVNSERFRQEWIHGQTKSAGLIDKLETIQQSPTRTTKNMLKFLPVAQSTPVQSNGPTKIIARATIESRSPLLTSDELERAETEDSGMPCDDDNTQKEMATFEVSEPAQTKPNSVYDKIKKSDSKDNYKLTFEEDELGDNEEDTPYFPHSPVFGNQLEYDSHKGHYSVGGRGYPHGGYQGDHSESDTFLVQLETESEMLRSREEADIRNLHDHQSIFENGGNYLGKIYHASSPELAKKDVNKVNNELKIDLTSTSENTINSKEYALESNA